MIDFHKMLIIVLICTEEYTVPAFGERGLMKIILTLDDDNRTMFNHRRQSRDIAVREKIAELVEGSRLWMNSYSGKLFRDTETEFDTAEDFLDRAKAGDFCFVENTEISRAAEKIEEFIIFRWNRKYPGDTGPDILPWENGFFCVESEEFPGNSHEKITMEIWRKEK